MEKISRKEAVFFEKLRHFFFGFKEIKLDRTKNEIVFKQYAEVNNEIKRIRLTTFLWFNGRITLHGAFFFLLLGTILFILPHFHEEHAEDIIKVTATIIFMLGPMESIISNIPLFSNANNSTKNILALEQQLEAALKNTGETANILNAPTAYEQLPFQQNIRLSDLSYAYPPIATEEKGFEIGPINLTLNKGELIFITGGNGSGKSTFLKLLTGLYSPKAGSISVDVNEQNNPNQRINASNYQQYRNLFTSIFTDFHLFDKLYGLEGIPDSVVQKLLVNMELPAEKTSYENGGFTNLNLSTGQKKRLALVVGILEDKPIYVFDEVAREIPWAEFIRRATLGLEVATPEYEYAYQFTLPTDPYCLRVLDIDEETQGFNNWRVEGRKLLAHINQVKTWSPQWGLTPHMNGNF